MTHLRQAAFWLLGPLCALGLLAGIVRPQDWRPRVLGDHSQQTVYAYRQWQSTGLKLQAGDQVMVRAQGEWMYSPRVGRHDAAGGWYAPDYYPLPQARGGALLGRVGEAGEPIYLGPRATVHASAPGTLYVRINDDLLGDNQGALSLQLTIIRAEPTPDP